MQLFLVYLFIGGKCWFKIEIQRNYFPEIKYYILVIGICARFRPMRKEAFRERVRRKEVKRRCKVNIFKALKYQN